MLYKLSLSHHLHTLFLCSQFTNGVCEQQHVAISQPISAYSAVTGRVLFFFPIQFLSTFLEKHSLLHL